MSKKVREWEKERKKLFKIFFDRDISVCEARLNGCLGGMVLSFHHKRKRVWYYNRPGLLGDFNQVLLVCSSCHAQLEKDKDLSEAMFKKLRG